MWLGRWLLRHLVLVWGVLVFVSGMAVTNLDLQYDAGGLESVVFLFFALLGQPVFVARWFIEVLGIAGSDAAIGNIALVLGLALCVAADIGLQMLMSQARSTRRPR